MRTRPSRRSRRLPQLRQRRPAHRVRVGQGVKRRHGAQLAAPAPFLREFTDRAWLDRVAATADTVGAAVTLVWVACDADSMRSYIRRRDAAKLADWAGYLAGVELGLRPAAPHQVIDNSLGAPPLQQQAAQFLVRLVDADTAADAG
ncbi:MAG: hypothetical protein ACRDRK_02590 [Pseudonocardia sp.]